MQYKVVRGEGRQPNLQNAKQNANVLITPIVCLVARAAYSRVFDSHLTSGAISAPATAISLLIPLAVSSRGLPSISSVSCCTARVGNNNTYQTTGATTWGDPRVSTRHAVADRRQ